MIILRKLEMKDAVFMIEWMHDDAISDAFQKNMRHMTMAEAEEFCKMSSMQDGLVSGCSMHFAIVDDGDDEYRGTISLKNVDLENKSAEYAVSLRKKYHGTTTATEATRLILEKGFYEFNLHRIYLNVLEMNPRAIRFYTKVGFVYEGTSRESIKKNGRYVDLRWYSMLESDWGGIRKQI